MALVDNPPARHSVSPGEKDSDDGAGCRVLYVRAYGSPQPKGSPKPVWSRLRRRREITLKTATGEEWERNIATACQIVAQQDKIVLPLEGPVVVRLHFLIPRPKSVKRRLPNVTPDGDKLERAVWDALQRAGVVHNDSQVTTWSGKKSYADDVPPGVELWVHPDPR